MINSFDYFIRIDAVTKRLEFINYILIKCKLDMPHAFLLKSAYISINNSPVGDAKKNMNLFFIFFFAGGFTLKFSKRIECNKLFSDQECEEKKQQQLI